MILRFSAGLIAAAAFVLVAPLAATAKGYQPSMVDSTSIEGQFLIAGAGSKEACEAKGKRWKARFGSDWTTADCQAGQKDYGNTGRNETEITECSCQK